MPSANIGFSPINFKRAYFKGGWLQIKEDASLKQRDSEFGIYFSSPITEGKITQKNSWKLIRISIKNSS